MYKFDAEKHCHTLNGKPLIGTTTALEVLSKPLMWWAAGMACSEFGWLNPKTNEKDKCMNYAELKLSEIKNMEPSQYIKLLNKAYYAHNTKKKTSAEQGIDLHESAENFIKDKIAKRKPLIKDERIEPFVLWAEHNVKQFLFSEIHLYSEKFWVGGIADFGYLNLSNEFVLGDIKSSKTAYFSHFCQLGAYDIQLTENKSGFDRDGNKIFELKQPIKQHAIFCFGDKFSEPVVSDSVENNRLSYECILELYKQKQLFEGK